MKPNHDGKCPKCGTYRAPFCECEVKRRTDEILKPKKKKFDIGVLSRQMDTTEETFAKEISASGLDEELHWKKKQKLTNGTLTIEIKFKPSAKFKKGKS